VIATRLENLTRYYALLLGVALVLAGVNGFVPFFTPAAPADAPHLLIHANYGLLLGLFPVNLVHNLIHLALGAWGVLAFRRYPSARTYCRGMALLLGLFTLLGLIPPLQTVFGLLPLYGHAIWLHGLEAAAAAYLGFVAPADTMPAGRPELTS
jgi:hypothetical protein